MGRAANRYKSVPFFNSAHLSVLGGSNVFLPQRAQRYEEG